MSKPSIQPLNRAARRAAESNKATAYGVSPWAYSIAEFIARMGISRATLYRLIATKQLRAVKLSGRTLIPASEVERLLNEVAQ